MQTQSALETKKKKPDQYHTKLITRICIETWQRLLTNQICRSCHVTRLTCHFPEQEKLVLLEIN